MDDIHEMLHGEDFKSAGRYKSAFERECIKKGVETSWSCTCRLSGEFHSVLDQNAQEIGSLTTQNLYKLERMNEQGEYVHILNVLFVKGRMAITNSHVLLGFKEDTTQWRIRNHHRMIGYEFKQKELRIRRLKDVVDRRKDYLMIEFPRRVHQHRDIVSKFVTIADQGAVREPDHVCLTGYMPGEQVVLHQSYSPKAKAVDGKITLMRGSDEVGELRHYWTYDIPSSEGYCGSIITAHDKRLPRKILGIHSGAITSGGQAMSFGQPVTRELLDRSFAAFDCMNEDSKIGMTVDDVEDVGEVHMSLFGPILVPSEDMEGHMVIGRLQSGGEHRNVRTRIVPSPVHGVIDEPTTAPACLKPVMVDGKRVDPMDLARLKVAPRPNVEVDEELLQRAIDDVTEMVLTDVDLNDAKVMPFEIAAKGIEGDDGYPPLNRKSSPGFGWPKTDGKREFFGEDEWKLDHPLVKVKLEEALGKLEKGERLNAVFVDTLKDERRPLEKVKACKTRLFSAGEMIFTIVFRMYFMGFAAHMWRHKIDFESCVGINAFNMEWHKLAVLLQSKGKSVIAGDFANYDASLFPEVLWGAFDVVNVFFVSGGQTERQKKARLALWSDVVNSIHVNGTKVYMWSQGNPSGCPITALLNCIVHSILARYVYLDCAKRSDPRAADLSSYRKYVAHVNFGDDDVWNVSDEIVEWFNQQTLTEAFARIGMKYTDEMKSESVVKCRNLEDISFLKRGFRYCDILSRWVAPLALATIREMPMWRHLSTDAYIGTAEVLEEAVIELALHGKDVFQAEVPKFKRAARVLAKRVPVHMWSFREALCILNNRNK